MKVTVVFDFPDIKNPNSFDADVVIDHITTLTKYIHNELVVDHPESSVYVDEAIGEAA